MSDSSSSSSSTPSSSASSSSRSSASSPSPTRPNMPALAPTPSQPREDDNSEEEYAPSPTLVAVYDNLMASQLPHIISAIPPLGLSLSSSPSSALPPPAGDDDDAEAEKGMTKAERQNAKKKRRKEREKAMKAAAAAAKGEPLPSQQIKMKEERPIPFRLFSTLAPVCLSSAEAYEITPNPRLKPLPLEVRERIRRLAAEAAVEAQSLPGLPSPSATDEEEDVWVADRAPPVFFAFTTKVEHKVAAVPAIQLRRKVVSEEGEGEGEEEEEEREKGEKEGRTKRRRRMGREFPVAQYWTPPPGIVARGYGHGFNNL